jgi:hypothetical protein
MRWNELDAAIAEDPQGLRGYLPHLLCGAAIL